MTIHLFPFHRHDTVVIVMRTGRASFSLFSFPFPFFIISANSSIFLVAVYNHRLFCFDSFILMGNCHLLLFSVNVMNFFH